MLGVWNTSSFLSSLLFGLGSFWGPDHGLVSLFDIFAPFVSVSDFCDAGDDGDEGDEGDLLIHTYAWGYGSISINDLGFGITSTCDIGFIEFRNRGANITSFFACRGDEIVYLFDRISGVISNGDRRAGVTTLLYISAGLISLFEGGGGDGLIFKIDRGTGILSSGDQERLSTGDFKIDWGTGILSSGDRDRLSTGD